MIGILDSGLGGVLTTQYIRHTYPHYDYLVVADTKYMPYGTKRTDRLRQRGFDLLTWMFEQGCHLVIIACNTLAAAVARDRQETNPHQKVLSITIPTIEKIIDKAYTSIAVIATNNTVNSGVYASLFERRGGQAGTSLTMISASPLVQRIEQGGLSLAEQIEVLLEYSDRIDDDTDAIVLGCTHFGLWRDARDELYPDKDIIDTAYEAIKKIGPYLHNHPTIEEQLSRNSQVRFCATTDNKVFVYASQTIMNEAITWETVDIQTIH